MTANSANERILARDLVRFEVHERYEDVLNLLDELVDYGTQLIVRCLSTAPRT